LALARHVGRRFAARSCQDVAWLLLGLLQFWFETRNQHHMCSWGATAHFWWLGDAHVIALFSPVWLSDKENDWALISLMPIRCNRLRHESVTLRALGKKNPNFGEDSHFLTNIFQMGWNHQPVLFGLDWLFICKNSHEILRPKNMFSIVDFPYCSCLFCVQQISGNAQLAYAIEYEETTSKPWILLRHLPTSLVWTNQINMPYHPWDWYICPHFP